MENLSLTQLRALCSKAVFDAAFKVIYVFGDRVIAEFGENFFSHSKFGQIIINDVKYAVGNYIHDSDNDVIYVEVYNRST